MKRTNLYLLLILVLLTPSKQLSAKQFISQSICAVNLLVIQPSSKKSKATIKKEKKKLKKLLRKNKRKLIFALLGGGLFGFLFRKKRKRRKPAYNDGGGSGILLTSALLGGLIWLFRANGMAWGTILLMLGIAILILALFIGAWYLAFKNS